MTEEEKKAIYIARNNILRGNDVESAALILEKAILDGVIIIGGRVNILKVATRQIINFIEEYKNKDEIIEKQQKEIEEKDKQIGRLKAIDFISCMRNGNELLKGAIEEHKDLTEKTLKLQTVSGYTIENLIDLFAKGFKLGDYKIGVDLSYDDYIHKESVREKMSKLIAMIKKYEQQMENDEETDISYEEAREYSVKIEVYKELLGE